MCVCVCLPLSLSIYIYVYTCIHTYIHTHTHTHTLRLLYCWLFLWGRGFEGRRGGASFLAMCFGLRLPGLLVYSLRFAVLGIGGDDRDHHVDGAVDRGCRTRRPCQSMNVFIVGTISLFSH